MGLVSSLDTYYLILKVIMRGKGMYTAIISCILLSVLMILSVHKVNEILLYLVILPTSLTSIAIDSNNITQFFNASLLVGALPQFFNVVILTTSLIYGTIYVIPYLILYVLTGNVLIPIASFFTVIVCVAIILRVYLEAVKRGYTVVVAP